MMILDCQRVKDTGCYVRIPEHVITNLHWMLSAVGADQGHLQQAEGQIHPQWLHRG